MPTNPSRAEIRTGTWTEMCQKKWDTRHQENGERHCSICMRDFNEKKPVVCLGCPCGLLLHTSCTWKWMRRQESGLLGPTTSMKCLVCNTECDMTRLVEMKLNKVAGRLQISGSRRWKAGALLAALLVLGSTISPEVCSVNRNSSHLSDRWRGDSSYGTALGRPLSRAGLSLAEDATQVHWAGANQWGIPRQFDRSQLPKQLGMVSLDGDPQNLQKSYTLYTKISEQLVVGLLCRDAVSREYFERRSVSGYPGDTGLPTTDELLEWYDRYYDDWYNGAMIDGIRRNGNVGTGGLNALERDNTRHALWKAVDFDREIRKAWMNKMSEASFS